jgi:small subunit ribosomal protein S17
MDSTSQQRRQTRQQKLTGIVSSVSGSKTVHVVVENLIKHPTYGKYMRRRTKLAVHDPKGTAKLGDTVEIVSCRPISKTKSWRLGRIIKSGNIVEPLVASGGES